MKILYVAMKHDYGDPTRGTSFEHNNFYDTLSRMPEHEVVYFPFDELLHARGREGMNAALLRAVHDERPDLVFFFLFTDEVAPQTIAEITQHSGAKTLNWFADDHWRWFNFSRHWAPLFHWAITTDARAVRRYRQIGYERVILSQWACNHYTYAPTRGPYEFDVTFVGQLHSNRRRIVRMLERAGIPVQCWGYGWPNGRLRQEEMIRVFSRSKINLSFAKGSDEGAVRGLARVFLGRRSGSTLRLVSPRMWGENLRAYLGKRRDQIKGRNFEIPGAGGFLITGDVEYLADYYAPGLEIVTFSTVPELIERIRYYLAHDEERERIRAAGYERTLRDHTYVLRFRAIFTAMGVGAAEIKRNLLEEDPASVSAAPPARQPVRAAG